MVSEAVDALESGAVPDCKPTVARRVRANDAPVNLRRIGRSAIFEYRNGNLVIHHGAQHQVMTNEPS
jgi:penicillin V acylase-like amidase (Ntn superfamily)